MFSVNFNTVYRSLKPKTRNPIQEKEIDRHYEYKEVANSI